jgi:hypothetical protein
LLPPVFGFPDFETLRELLSDERPVCAVVLEKRLYGEKLLEPLLKLRGLEPPVLLALPPDLLTPEKPWKGEPAFPVLRLVMAPSIGRATD